MQVFITVDGTIAASILGNWTAEHAKFYGRPEIREPLSLPFNFGAFLGLPCGQRGFNENDQGDRSGWLTGRGWWAVLVPGSDNSTTLVVNAPRHRVPVGIKEAFAGLTWHPAPNGSWDSPKGSWTNAAGATVASVAIYETTRPELSPFVPLSGTDNSPPALDEMVQRVQASDLPARPRSGWADDAGVEIAAGDELVEKIHGEAQCVSIDIEFQPAILPPAPVILGGLDDAN